MLFWLKRQEQSHGQPLYGVNLGGWLLLEKWMTPSLFSGTDATDEYSLMHAESSDIPARVERHRETFITPADFAWLQLHGIRAVRLPVGYWVFGDEEPYMPAIEYVDRAFRWAEECGMKILLDMHGAPGSQNGWDHSGRSGAVGWYKDEANIIKTLDIISRLTKRYKDSPSFLGIELLNEPKWTIPRRKLLRYYEAAYKLIRHSTGKDAWIVFSDNFRPKHWKRKLKAAEFPGMFIDRHEYQTFDKKDKRLDILGHMHKTFRGVPKLLLKMQKHHPVIVGEWSVTLDPQSLQGLSPAQITEATRAYGAAQLIIYEETAAWFYWSYKTESGGTWNFKDMVETGILPNFSAVE